VTGVKPVNLLVKNRTFDLGAQEKNAVFGQLAKSFFRD
jgi:hypothetical protein